MATVHDEKNNNALKSVADTLFDYLRAVIYNPTEASLNMENLPDEFQDLGKGLQYFSNCVIESTTLAKELARGNLNCELPSSGNEMAAPLKMLHASLKHLTWQTQQVAQGDYKQRVDFMGTFSDAFNDMVTQLAQRWQFNLNERSRLKRQVELILDNCPDPILLFDKQERLSYVSDSFLRIYPAEKKQDMLGKSVRELFSLVIPNNFSDTLKEIFNSAVSEKRTKKTDCGITFGTDGELRYYQLQITPMADEAQNTEGILMFMHDTTEITEAKESAERSSRAKSEFLARMSHEMRTPMNAVLGMTAIHNAANSPERKNYAVVRINEAARHLLKVINEILDMSDIESDKFNLSSNDFDLTQMLDATLGATKFEAWKRKQNLSIDIDGTLPSFVSGDERRLNQAISNILSNAVKFTQNGGSILFRAQNISESDGICTIRFTVKDNGAGIPKKHLNKLFTPFEQADGGGTRKHGGTGLGLIVSKRIIEMMHGNIRVESEEGKGSCFTFDVNLKNAKNKEKFGDCDEEGIFCGRSILLVEDIEINREVLISLVEHTGVQVDVAVDGIEAVEKYVAQPQCYGVIFMDINMPNMDGYESARCIRNSGLPRAESIPIIALTANTFRADIEKCIAAGMNGHIGKPVDINEVISVLRKYL